MGKKEKSRMSDTSRRKKRQPSPEKNMERKTSSSSMDSLVNDTRLPSTVEGHDKSSEISCRGRSTPIANQFERLPPVRRQTRLYGERSPIVGDRSSDEDEDYRERDKLSGWEKISRPALRDVYHPDYPFTKKDPSVQPQEVLPLPTFTSSYREFEGFCDFIYPVDPNDKVSWISIEMKNWTNDYCGSPEDIENRMTAEQKQAVLDFLGDWCLYNDWDSLIATFPNQRFRFHTFTQAVIMKDIFQSLVENPFYYIDLDTHWDGRSETLPPTYGKKLYQHWQNLLRVDELSAERWRISTVQMMNRYLEPIARPKTEPIWPVEAWDCTTGIRSWNIRQRYVNQLVRNMLDRSSLISPMLLDHVPEKELDTKEPFRRDGLLRRCYEQACEFAVQMWTRDGSAFRFDENINEIGPFTELENPERDKRHYKRWWTSGYDHYDCPFDHSSEDSYKGRETAIIFWPTIWTIHYKHLHVPPRSREAFGGRSSIEGREWIYMDDRDWLYEVLASGRVYLAGRGLVKPTDAPCE
ncbi:uncharacterized protein N7483_008951 [Penicillium malachiteum]|uniref:uncharacterized protein n=1 Tax=Penicillium malachiteum TaxID=1324776 RepID=UPI002547BE12|nr:uncharacterized protein N7483_008951 [Penicillium malachiteum]KAJ5721017.1 hypothetical protein N7483_008951 [Penicillium malachiteum]